MTDIVLEGSGQPADRLIPSIIPGFEDEENDEEDGNSEKSYGYAPNRAKKLYKEVLKELKTERLPIIKLLIKEDYADRKIADYLKTKLKENLDMDIEIVTNDKDSYVLRLCDEKPIYADPMGYLKIFKTEYKDNYGFYSNPEYDKLFEQLKSEMDEDKRADLIFQMQQILVDDAAVLIDGYYNSSMIYSKNVGNAHIHTADYYWLTTEITPAQ